MDLKLLSIEKMRGYIKELNKMGEDNIRISHSPGESSEAHFQGHQN
jgi:hypothetical protein